MYISFAFHELYYAYVSVIASYRPPCLINTTRISHWITHKGQALFIMVYFISSSLSVDNNQNLTILKEMIEVLCIFKQIFSGFISLTFIAGLKYTVCAHIACHMKRSMQVYQRHTSADGSPVCPCLLDDFQSKCGWDFSYSC